MRIAIVGGRGQLGHDLQRHLPGECILLDQPEFDIRDTAGVLAALSGARPDLVINAAAMTNVDGCEEDPRAAHAVNATGAGHVAAAVARLDVPLIQISTDFVFGGQPGRRTAYLEDDVPDPLSVYGASKLAGERETLAACPRALVVRTCGLYGVAGARGKGGNFVETMLRLADGDRPIRVVADQVLSPTSSDALARVLAGLAPHPPRGILHVTAPDRCSWHEFACAIIHGVDPDREVAAIPTSDYPLPARRPSFSALRSRRLEELGLDACPPWREMLAEYLRQRRG